MQQGDIVLVPFPFSDLSSNKVRPAVIISNKTLKGDDLICCAVTSHVHKDTIKIQNNNLKSGKLPLISYIKPKKIVTLDRAIIRKEVASLNEETIKQIIKELTTCISYEK